MCVGFPQVARLLLGRGASIEAANIDGVTPLCAAVYKGHEGCAQLLLENNAGVDVPRVDGKSPLHVTCLTGHAECARLLLLWGAAIETRARASSDFVSSQTTLPKSAMRALSLAEFS